MTLRVCVGEPLAGRAGEDEFDVATAGQAAAAAGDDVVEEIVDGTEIEFGIIVVEVRSVRMNSMDVDVDRPIYELRGESRRDHL